MAGQSEEGQQKNGQDKSKLFYEKETPVEWILWESLLSWFRERGFGAFLGRFMGLPLDECFVERYNFMEIS